MWNAPFKGRKEAGEKLAERLQKYREREDVVVLGLARGGMPVAAQVAEGLDAPLDVIVIRKLGAPGRGELAIGAIAPEGVQVLNDDIVETLKVSDDQIEEIRARELGTLESQLEQFRRGREAVPLEGRTLVLVDDGLATGATMRAAIKFGRSKNPRELIVAAPIGAPETCRKLESLADDVICLEQPTTFFAVGQGYRHFPQVSSDEVEEMLAKAAG